MKLKPMADNVLLKQSEAQETTASGIILATKDVTMTVKAGDKVVVGKYTGSEIKLDGEEYKFVKQDDILAIVTE